MNATEKDNVFYCDCGFSWRRDMSGSHNCEDGLRAKLTDMAVQLANAESKCRELAAELSAVDKIHNEAVFITDDHYEQCPSKVQKMIRSLAVLQIPVYDAFLAEVRASARNEGINYAASRLAAAFNHGFVDKPLAEVCDVVRMILDTKEELANSMMPAADGLSGEYAEKFLAEFAAQPRLETAQ
ncbi:hypothetical protein [Citrobacter youngae]|uniref:hypothetical protein n=1 Tax=Citrobacter youngae TaxID=133448 RepID=UPI000E1233F8|nr:hypothetical protein [Citrobacter youngae]SUX97364.1 Uncharacterised protein [Citrobacter youngae]